MRRQITLALAFMEYKCRISEIKRRAKLIGAPLRDVCEAAGVNVSTFYRWEKEDADPRMRSMFKALAKIEAALQERERRILVELVERSPHVVQDAIDQAGNAT